ncbi:Helix-turn-helix domain-containing protein [Pedobacter westerhofensis]|uniref:Helix-turn-helix domain-containing protein n=1 Tax=Pedobacter westerhofensis TaxID=425512 RepID=A0A521B082_9SPHI|nr:AraC family transcriptional regulator [Pedobacter westerhofensis]SMO40502.1 Helix-turn-helix domain-containing protein [Pedobacter westerhofensis]
MPNTFQYTSVAPEKELSIFIESIGMFGNFSSSEKEVVVLPDGRIDLFFMFNAEGQFKVLLMGLETEPEKRIAPAGMSAYALSFTPLGMEYIMQTSIADILNSARELPDNFWGNRKEHFTDLETFKNFVMEKIGEHLPAKVDERKLKLFEMIYASNGELSVAELSGKTGWSSRQMNRYFNAKFGLSLKAYCDILRFRTSLAHIAVGKLFPELDFSDQSHFIKEIKKYSGVLPKDLSKNKDDRFVLLSLLKER